MAQKNIYAKELGIDLASGRETEYFKWFLACLLFGKPIQQEVAKRAYQELVKEGSGWGAGAGRSRTRARATTRVPSLHIILPRPYGCNGRVSSVEGQ